MAAIANELNC
uniref:Uncharacterized protein n=1 Tax=Anguilla anguilla TaxID=7936 RepID=A0A0E9VPM5_ANGAN